MGVYVDELRPVAPSKNWPYKYACHLVADTVEELHYFAGRIQLQPCWFQGKSSFPHYDLTKNFRLLAVKLGAIEITNRRLVELMKEHRKVNDMLTKTVRTTKQVPVKVLSLKWFKPTVLISLKCTACRKPIGDKRWGQAWAEDERGKYPMRLCEKCGEIAEKTLPVKKECAM